MAPMYGVSIALASKRGFLDDVARLGTQYVAEKVIASARPSFCEQGKVQVSEMGF
jgi:hypothetical protein